jgi:hypothetical protein
MSDYAELQARRSLCHPAPRKIVDSTHQFTVDPAAHPLSLADALAEIQARRCCSKQEALKIFMADHFRLAVEAMAARQMAPPAPALTPTGGPP